MYRRRKPISIIYWIITIAVIATIAIVVVSLLKGSGNYEDNRGVLQTGSETESGSNIEENGTDDSLSQEDSSSQVDPYEGLEKITINNSGSVDGDLMLVNKDYGVPEKYEEADYPSIYGKGTPYVVRSTEMYLQPQALEALSGRARQRSRRGYR